MKRFLIGLILIALTVAGFTAYDSYRRVVNTSFGPGEHLEYRVHYGFLNAAEAIVDVSPTVYNVNNRPCYRVSVDGRTVGAFDLVTRIRDTWRSYIDTSAILPQKFITSLQENKYRKENNITFDHGSNVVRQDEKGGKNGIFKVPDNVHDFISGYYFLRTIDFNRLTAGQVIEVPAFYDDTVYQMRVRYRGKQQISTKFGKINVLRLNPVLPSNKMFKSDESIRIFVSDDANKIPVKVEVDLWVGSMVMDLRDSKNLRKPLQFSK